MISKSRIPLAVLLFTLVAGLRTVALADAPAAGTAADVPPPAVEPSPPTTDPYTEEVRVISTRLADHDDPSREVPASTTIIGREQIAGSGARTLQELLGRIPGAILFDQIGNGIETTFDLRGFTGGGITVLLDGVRINDPRNNLVALETLGLDAVERVEIMRGAAAATVGGGSAAGVINIVTRTGTAPFGLSLTGGYGSFDTLRAGLQLYGQIPRQGAGDRAPDGPGTAGAGFTADPIRSGTAAGFDWFVSAQRDTTDGFRENADGRLTRLGATAGYTFTGGSRLALALHSADDDLGAPGALTLAEIDEDPEQAPYNQLDGSDLTSRQGTLMWRGDLGGPFSLAANLSYLARDVSQLTTGRSAAAFGGFDLDSKVRTTSGAVQSTARFVTGDLEHSLAFGAEGARGTNDADACGTLVSDLSTCDPASFFNSSNRTEREDAALFVQESLSFPGGVTVLAGGRWDRSRFDYLETLPDPSNDRSRTFSETSWKGGVAWNPARTWGLYASYGESFQAPTVEDLFAFPGFGSNPDLEPVLAKNYEVGARGSWQGATVAPAGAGRFAPSVDYSLSVYRTNLAGEIIFTPHPTPQNPFAGLNENVGRSYREGIELSAGWRPVRWGAFSAALGWTRARFLCTAEDPSTSARCAGDGGDDDANTVPLVPSHRYAATGWFTIPHGFGLRLDLLHVGSQVLTNDEANAQPRLDPYFVADLRGTWSVIGPGSAGSQGVPRGATAGGGTAGGDGKIALEIFVEARNLFDEEYATRGIYAFNAVTLANETFLTPAPPRSVAAGFTLGY